ncbi:50S ribosomal protein L5 [Candidatus Uhrbacteria bacterium]|nr:50S ribosomal protein L5 [Candidatus Uhrbacteria bacterium]
MNAFQTHYQKKVIPELQKQFDFKNAFQVPRITKVTLNVGVGKSLKDPNYVGIVEDSLARIAGQKPVRTKAKKSIASFKVRAGQVVGLSVTLRKARMLDFLEKLIHVALPRVRDFRGLDVKSVDRQGNLNIGFRENLAFPEIKSDEIERTHGLEVNISSNAKNREEGVALFTLLGFPFKKNEPKK